MSLKVKDIEKIIEEYAPSYLKEDYDNVGLMVGEPEKEVSSILFALDCTKAVIDEAETLGANLIITHHPLLFRKPSTITTRTLQGDKILRLIKNDICLYSCHTNLDSVNAGLNDIVTELLGFTVYDIIDKKNSPIKNCGIGRIVQLSNEITLEELCLLIKEKLSIDKLRFCGNNEMKLSKLAIINGSGQDYFESAKKEGVNCIITGDTTYHYVSDCLEENIAVIDAGHFGTEWVAYKIFSNTIKNKIEQLGISNKIYISKQCYDPYKYI